MMSSTAASWYPIGSAVDVRLSPPKIATTLNHIEGWREGGKIEK